MPGVPSALRPYAPFTSTPIYNQCAILLPPAGPFAYTAIPLHLTKMDNQSVTSTTVEWASGPVMDLASNTSSGGNAIGYGVNQLPRLAIEGWMDTPYTVPTTGEDPPAIPGVTIGGVIYNNPQILASYFDGRVLAGTTQPLGPWIRVDPIWYRDPYGRCYATPRLLAFTATRIEAVPYRHNFTMSLLVGRNTVGN